MSSEKDREIEIAARRQAEFCLEVMSGETEVPAEVMERARLVLLDTLGCYVAGVRVGGGNLTAGGEPGGLVESTRAILRTELYEGSRVARGHPAVHVLPSLVFSGRADSLGLEEATRLFVAAYEIAGRWGSSLTLSRSSFGHGMALSVGAAIVAAVASGYGASDVAGAILLAETLPVPSTWQSVWDASELHDAYPALGARQALLASDLVRSGVSATGGMVRSAWEEIMAAKLDAGRLGWGIGREWLIAQNYFKVSSGCRFANMYEDMLAELIDAGLDAASVETVDVEAYAKASWLTGTNPVNRLAVQFSIPCLLAVQLLEGTVTPMSIDHALAVHREAVASLARRVRVIHSPDLDELLPNVRAGRLTVRTRSGDVLRRRARGARGDFDGPPFGRDEILAKLSTLLGGSSDVEGRAELVDSVLDGRAPNMDVKSLRRLVGGLARDS